MDLFFSFTCLLFPFLLAVPPSRILRSFCAVSLKVIAVFCVFLYKRSYSVSLKSFYLFIFGCAGFSCCVQIFSSCVAWTPEHWSNCAPAVRHVGSSQARDQTHVPCVDSQPLDHQGSPSFFSYLSVHNLGSALFSSSFPTR